MMIAPASLRVLRLLPVIIAAAFAAAPADAATEQAVKAAFLTKFGRYVQWPAAVQPRPGEAFVICVIGRDPFGRRLDTAAAGQSVGKSPIVVRRLPAGSGGGGCHVAYLGDGGSLAAIGARPVLTVTDARNGRTRGMIHFAVIKGRVGFHIDEAAAAHSNLAVSSRLLGIAASVKARS